MMAAMMILRRPGLSFAAAGVVIACAVPTVSGATPPTLTSLPAVNAPTLIADDTTPYTVSLTVTDVDGYNDVRCIRVMFGFSEAGGDQTLGRGYMDWGKTDADVTQYGGTWVIADATGGGRWAYRTDQWGGITYITPLSCETTVSGAATGGSGSRTVNWTFTVKPAWAFNPVMNDADAWLADATFTTSWIDGATFFDVVPATCTMTSATPTAPVVSNPTSTTLDVAINPADATTDAFVIMVSPSVGGRMFVQSDGTLGTRPKWFSKASWGTRTVSGLLWGTEYSFSVRAYRNTAGYCPSEWGPAATGTTLSTPPVIDPTQGTPFSPWVRGQCPYRSVPASGYGPLWDLTIGSMARGLGGGLDADCYDWRDINSGSNWGLVGGKFTTLEFLQYARDHDAVPLMTANAFGGGYRDAVDGTFVCQTVNPEGQAADWVRYINFILRNYRQGDEGNLTGEDLRVYDSIVDWGERPKLLAPAEGDTPLATYWEIGNEPELGGFGGFLSNHYLGPTDYRDRYKLIAAAMLAVDPTLKFGPCLISAPDSAGQWLPALAADPTIPIDFVGYHPYYGAIKGSWGNLEGMTTALRDYKGVLQGAASRIRSTLGQHGRSNVDLVASEWNPMNWDAPGFMQRSMPMALGVVETCFTFAEDGVRAGTFWEQPQSKLGAVGAFEGLRDHMGDVLVATGGQLGLSPGATDFRIYITRNSGDDTTLMIWGLNFNDSAPVTVDLALAPCRILSATLKHYGKPGDDAAGGDTSLTTTTGMAWDQADVTAGFDTRNFPFTMEDAEITLLILQTEPTTPVDHDRDGDVDLDDFGWFQGCLNGSGQVQTHPDCQDAVLDGDVDVDGIDLTRFLNCLTGEGLPADPDCAG